jgi:hypothetical protein
VAPIEDDINFPATTLTNSEITIDLVTNCSNRKVAPIRYDDIDLDEHVQAVRAKRTSFQ